MHVKNILNKVLLSGWFSGECQEVWRHTNFECHSYELSNTIIKRAYKGSSIREESRLNQIYTMIKRHV